MDWSMVTFEDIIEYFAVMFKKVLAFFGVEIDEETSDNIGSMIDGMLGYEPEV